MNARFAAVALSSCLSATLASQLLPLPSLMSLVEANKPSGTPIADNSGSPAEAKRAQLLQMQASQAQDPRTTGAPQAVSAPQIAEVLQASTAAVDAAQTLPPADAPRAVEAPQAVVSPVPEPLLAAATNQVASGEVTVSSADAAPAAAGPVSPPAAGDVVAADTSQASDNKPSDNKPQASFDIASADPSEMLAPAQPTPASPEQLPPSNPLAPFNAAGIDQCVVEGCVDQYLWALYQRTPKQDKVKVDEQRMVTIKRKGKMVTVARTFSKLVDEDFAWKDLKAAEKAGMPLQTYVIGGMDQDFKLKLFHVLQAAEQAGLSPGITSAFRDDYRQAIASGLKAASNRSYHGGSLRGGYGHGLAADIVSVNGATRAERWAATETFWKWIDDHGKEFGIGRPYLSYDPPHVGPVDGEEWAKHRGGDNIRLARAEMKTQKHPAAAHEHGAAKRARAAASPKVDRIRSARNKPGRTA